MPRLDIETVKRHLRELVSVYAPTGSEEKLYPVLRSIVEELGGYFVVDDAGNFVASSSRDALKMFTEGYVDVAMLSHLDTVPGYIEPRVEGSIVWGRGAVDARGPLLAMLYASILEEYPCNVVGGGLVGEEGDSPGAHALLGRGFHAKYVIIGEPSGTNGVIIGYRGSAPTLIECRAVGGHAANADPSASAFEKLLEVYSRLRNVNEVSVIATVVQAGEYPNKLPERAFARLDVRLPRGWSRERLEAVLREALVDGCSYKILSYTPPVYVKPSDPVPRALQRALLRLGLRPRLATKRGTSDMNILFRVSESIAAYGPGDPRLSHSSVERIDARDVLNATYVLINAAKELCGWRR